MIRKDLDPSRLSSLHSLMAFDDVYTGPLHGYRDAMDYYTSCSSASVIDRIKVPTLIVNAANDPFLSPQCYPKDALKGHSHVRFESPSRGGHVGFTRFGRDGVYWSELRALEFVLS